MGRRQSQGRRGRAPVARLGRAATGLISRGWQEGTLSALQPRWQAVRGREERTSLTVGEKGRHERRGRVGGQMSVSSTEESRGSREESRSAERIQPSDFSLG